MVDHRSFTGFGIDQCPACGSKNVKEKTVMKAGGGPNEIDDHVNVTECGNCRYKA